MADVVNTGQAEAWNGYEGRHWADNADRFDDVNGGFNAHLLDAVRPGDRVLDIGCGTGQVTRQAAARSGTGAVLGVDLSAPMLGTAERLAAGLSTVDFLRADAQVHPFAPGSFDVAVSRFGVMFFADPVAAFVNVGRALGPGGRLRFLCLSGFAGTDLGSVFDAMAPHIPNPTGADGTGPTSFADPDRARDVLTRAGFRDFACAKVEADQVWGRDVPDAAAFMADWGPVRHHLGQVAPEAAERAKAALVEALGRFAVGGAVRLKGEAWLVSAGI
ncbi:class I SAM-dependent methyltransferase [Actinokineospora auranticolor]|uniref:Methyltransferase family protein n=1 Tax=Actinokineospora auranticolor TaxID=155976 RepID=A0A2S6GJR9_9PSEU|nr:class I SAM-dependent methyltransferase [Actinokineospora auranticolor]PPK65455.1 methyltransferase family protein [Actinokineospora auranticolor]